MCPLFFPTIMPHFSRVEALFQEGNRLMASAMLDAAASRFEEALALAPEVAELHANLGLVHERRGNLEIAEVCYRQARTLDPALVDNLRNLGVLLARQRRFAEAEAAYFEALEWQADSAVTWSNLGVLYAGMKREEEAEAFFRKAMALDPAYDRARFNLSCLLLRQGRFDEGWECHEARGGYAGLERHLQLPRWQGASLVGKSILIGIEAGHGDMIQFCRYAEELKCKGALRVGLLCHPALKSLFASLVAVDAVYSLDESVPGENWDCWVPPLSLPFLCGTQFTTIPAELPYLQATEEHCSRWRGRLPEEGLRVGLAWKGNPRFENDAQRSLPSLSLLASLGQIGGVSFISLQKGAGEEEALSPPAGLPLLALGHEITDFADSAAILQQLDLIISVDSALAHLAGALGKPCWVLLPDYMTDWRWLKERSDSPWYPGVMRLFRQPDSGGWPEVVAELETALRQWVQSRT